MYLNQKLAALSDAEQRMVCLSALPLWLDADILVTLHGSQEEADKALEILEKLLLLTRVSENRYNIRSEEHRQLFRMAYARYLVDFEETHLRLAHYFIELVEKTDDSSEQFSLGRSVIFHLLAVGEPAGWEWLAYLFDDAEARGLTGVTRQLIQPLQRLRFLFSLEDRATLSVYRARAANLTGNYRYAERLLRTICSLKVSPILLAVSHRVLGQALADQQHWEEAIQALKKSLKILEPSGNSFSLALTWSSMGDLYQEMANFSGGIQPAKSQESDKPWVERLRKLIYLPNYIYSALSQRIQRMPFIDVDFSYQNWVVARLMLAAADAYRQAEKALPENPSPQALYLVRIGRVRMYTRVGLLRRAELLLDELEQWPYVEESGYRRATILYWRAELARLRGQNNLADRMLREVGRTFDRYRRALRLAKVYRRLGMLSAEAGNIDSAIVEFLQAAEYYWQASQPLMRTAVLNQIAELTGEENPAEDGHYEYLARFPKQLAGVYRLVAFLVLAFLLLLTIGLAGVELLLSLFAEDLAETFGDPSVFVFGLAWLAWPLIAIWIFQLAYLASALIISFNLPIGLVESDPPLRIIIDPAGLTLAQGSIYHKAERFDLPWKTIDGVQEVLYRIWTQPIELISDFDVLSQGKRRRIPVDTIGFQDLRRNLANNFTNVVWQSSTFTLFTPAMILLMVLLVLAGSIFFQLAFEVSFVIFGVLVGAFASVALFFPLLAFWRMTFFLIRRRWETLKGYPSPPLQLGEVLIYLGLIVWTVLTLVFLRIVVATWLAR